MPVRRSRREHIYGPTIPLSPIYLTQIEGRLVLYIIREAAKGSRWSAIHTSEIRRGKKTTLHLVIQQKKVWLKITRRKTSEVNTAISLQEKDVTTCNPNSKWKTFKVYWLHWLHWWNPVDPQRQPSHFMQLNSYHLTVIIWFTGIKSLRLLIMATFSLPNIT